MLLDKLAQLDNAHAYTAAAISTNVYNQAPMGSNLIKDIGAGEEVHLSILVTTTVLATGGASTTVFTLESDDNTSLSTAVVHWTGPSIAKATLVAGYWYALGVPIPPGEYQQYIGIRMTPTTNDWTSGAVSAWLHKGRYDIRAYASGVTNSV